MASSAQWFAQAAQAREKAAELHSLARTLRMEAASVAVSSTRITQILDAETWGGEKAVRTHTEFQGSVHTVRYVSGEATIDADELELRARQLDQDAEHYEAEGKRQAFLEAEAIRQQHAAAAQVQAAQTQAAQNAAAAAAKASSSSATQSAPAEPPAAPAPNPIVFSAIPTTTTAAAVLPNPDPPCDGYYF